MIVDCSGGSSASGSGSDKSSNNDSDDGDVKSNTDGKRVISSK